MTTTKATAKATAKASTKTKSAATAELPLVVATEAVPQEVDATTTSPDGAIVPAGETTAISRWEISRWEALALRIAEAEGKAPTKRFDYRDKWENKAARSWVNELRGIKGSMRS